MARLRRVDCSGPGITRRRRGRGFEYRDDGGRRIADDDVLARIRELAIPPAWEDVWVCPYPNGHLQATGIDAAGRKQYRYHDDWRARRDQEKFDAMLDFAATLPRMRRRVRRDLRGDEMSRARVLACAARLLDLGFFRIGGEDYAEENDSYGLATLLKRHVRVERDSVVFDYEAKSGKRRVQEITDPAVREILAALKRRRGGGSELLAYREGRRWVDVRSDDVNEYVKATTAERHSAKDFRTWNATVLAAVALAGQERPETKTARKRAVRAAIESVAAFLGNTPAVCRASYIDPRVIDRYQSGWTIGPAIERLGGEPDLGNQRVRESVESAVLDLIREDESPALARAA
ncbi:MAG: topoisomerase [Solirubrobacteraceae bacterium]|nr:topoisomerase [Solirubrobacteraceae bacterium]